MHSQYQAQFSVQAPPQYEKCPKHQMNDIVLFCLAGDCKEPLCKDCCKLHVQWHNQSQIPAELDTVDNVRQTLLNDVHNLKVRFEEERAILHHFSDGEHSELLKSIHHKLDKVKKTLLQTVNDYCSQLEEQVKQRLLQHRASHPGEKKDLHHKLNAVITDLDNQEKGLLQPKYIKAQERNHDLEGLSSQIDNALKHYLSNMFDVFIHEDKLQKIVQSLHEYVEIHQANLTEELDIYTKKIREGKRVFGVPQSDYQQQLPQKGFKQTAVPSGGLGQQSIYDTKRYQPGSANKFGNSNIASYGDLLTSKNYESRLQTNNEKLKQYYA